MESPESPFSLRVDAAGTPRAVWQLPDGGHRMALVFSDDVVGLRLSVDDGAAACFVAALTDGVRRPAEFSVRLFARLPSNDGTLVERPITVDQTNESVVVADHLVVKWLPRPSRRRHPAPDLLDHLARVGFTRMPTPYAALFWTPADGAEVLLASVAGYLPDAVNGWEWCVCGICSRLGRHRMAVLPSWYPDRIREGGPL
jgi:maltokinase